MKNYREQVQICCATCLHAFDVEYYDGCRLVCVEDLPVTADVLYQMYSRRLEEPLQEELEAWRDNLYMDETREVSQSGICDNYEHRGN